MALHEFTITRVAAAASAATNWIFHLPCGECVENSCTQCHKTAQFTIKMKQPNEGEGRREREREWKRRSAAQCQKDVKDCHQQSATKYLLGTMCRINYHFPSTYKRAKKSAQFFHFFRFAHFAHRTFSVDERDHFKQSSRLRLLRTEKNKCEKQLKYTPYFKLIKSLGLKLIIFVLVHSFCHASSLSWDLLWVQ